MHSTTISGAAVLLALAPAALAIGSASVTNNCAYSIYYASISGTAEGLTEMAPGGSMTESFGTEDVGTSIKLSLNNTLSTSISQFEFTWSGDSIFYDLSNINGDPSSPEGYPFASGGVTITPSVPSSSADPTCVPVVCPAGTVVCTAAYNAPDDPKTLVCPSTASLSMVLCSDGSSSSWKRDAHTHPNSHTRQIRHPHGRVWVTV